MIICSEKSLKTFRKPVSLSIDRYDALFLGYNQSNKVEIIAHNNYLAQRFFYSNTYCRENDLEAIHLHAGI